MKRRHLCITEYIVDRQYRITVANAAMQKYCGLEEKALLSRMCYSLFNDSDHPCRLFLGRDYAISEIKRCSSSQFDPDVVQAFVSILEKDSQTVFRA